MLTAVFSALLVSHDPSEIILIYWSDAQEKNIIIILLTVVPFNICFKLLFSEFFDE